MTITRTTLTSGSSTTDASSFTSASISVSANKLAIIAVYVNPSGTMTNFTVSGLSRTWTQVATTAGGANIRQAYLFRSTGAAATGTLTFTQTGATTLTNIFYTVIELEGADLSGTNGANAIVQTVNAKPTGTTSVSQAFSSTPTSGNVCLALVGTSVQETPAVGAGWTSIHSGTLASNANGYQFMVADPVQNNIAASWTTSGNGFIVGVEIKSYAKFSTLTEDWSSGTINSAKWNTTGTPTPTVVSGALRAVDSGTYPGVVTVGRYDLTGSSVFVQLAEGQTNESGREAYFTLAKPNTTDKIEFMWVGSGSGSAQLLARRWSGGVSTNVVQFTYNGTTHRYLRIRESGGTIFWDTSPDASTWTNRGSWLSTFSSVSDLALSVGAGNWNGLSGTGYAEWDNINVASSNLDKLKLGTNVVALKLGTNAVSKVYLGTTQVWP